MPNWASESLVQRIKDKVIESGAEQWARPLWMRISGRKLDQYDTELFEVIARVLRPDSVCIDVGCHKGLILDACIRRAPRGTFHGFEPIPYLAGLLRRKYARNSRVKIHELALSDAAGHATFHINKASMGRSGLKFRSEDGEAAAERQACPVTLARLDDVLPNIRVDFIKIDVEGAELGVLQGASHILARSRPVVAFEHGLGGADVYGTTPGQVFDVFADAGLMVSLMARFLAGQAPLSRAEFCQEFDSHSNYFFLAHP